MTWLIWALVVALAVKWTLVVVLLHLIRTRGWPPPGMKRTHAAWWGGFLQGVTFGAIKVDRC